VLNKAWLIFPWDAVRVIKARSFGILVSYTAWFIKAKPTGRYAALTNQAVHDGPESGDAKGRQKPPLTLAGLKFKDL
jgi:hypothetical protein